MHELAARDLSLVFIELGVTVLGLSILSRLASRLGFSTIPLYLLAGLAFGNGGLVPLRFSANLVHVGAEIGVLLLLFMLGLEYSGRELGTSLRAGLPAGLLDLALNFPPGWIAGRLLGWEMLACVLLGGATWISSSGVAAKVLSELGRMKHRETPVVLSILVLEDLAMAIYLPLVAVLLIGQSLIAGALSVLVALATVGAVLFIAVRFGAALSRLVAHRSDEVTLFTTLGLVLLVAGVAERLQVSAAIGAFLVGIGLSGPIVQQAHRQIGPMRDLAAATFFLFFGLQIDPATLPPVMLAAFGLGVVGALTKLISGGWAARRAGVDRRGCLRAGAALVARGEFSIVIAGLGVGAGLEPRLGPLAAAYVLFTAILGPVLARTIVPLSAAFLGRSRAAR